MASEKVRVIAFDTVDLDDGDWDGPTPKGEFLTYTSKHAAASIRVTRGGKVVVDGDYGARKTVLIDDDVIHLPEGMGKEMLAPRQISSELCIKHTHAAPLVNGAASRFAGMAS